MLLWQWEPGCLEFHRISRIWKLYQNVQIAVQWIALLDKNYVLWCLALNRQIWFPGSNRVWNQFPHIRKICSLLKGGFRCRMGSSSIFHVYSWILILKYCDVFYRLVLPSLGNNGVVSQLIWLHWILYNFKILNVLIIKWKYFKNTSRYFQSFTWGSHIFQEKKKY